MQNMFFFETDFLGATYLGQAVTTQGLLFFTCVLAHDSPKDLALPRVQRHQSIQVIMSDHISSHFKCSSFRVASLR